MTKMKNLFLIITFLFYSYCYSQYDYNNSADALSLCIAYQNNSFTSNNSTHQTSFSSFSNANDELSKILSVIGASKRFIVQPCSSINNALAVQYKGVRYILYDPVFMSSLSNGNSWSDLFILAHEIGHHINGHALDIILYATETVEVVSLAENRKQELEADEFAGFVLAKLGATFEQAIYSIDKYSSNGSDINSTHPSKSKRLVAIKTGFENAIKQSDKYQAKSLKLTADDYFYRGIERDQLNDFTGAISDYKRCIELEVNFLEAYNNRGLLYLYKTNQYDLALKDFNKAIELEPNQFNPIFNRALVKMNMSQSREDPLMYEAMADLTKAIQINPSSGGAYIQRGMCKYRSLGWNVACTDFIKAKELGEELPDYIKSKLDEFGCN